MARTDPGPLSPSKTLPMQRALIGSIVHQPRARFWIPPRSDPASKHPTAARLVTRGTTPATPHQGSPVDSDIDWPNDINRCRFIDVHQASALYRLLGDEARLRLLRVLDRERLNVTELTSIIGLAQSGISRHLGMLKDAGLVSEEKDAGYTYFRLAPALSDNGHRALWAALQEQFAAAGDDAAVQADEARLQE